MTQDSPPQMERKMLSGCFGYVLLSLGGFLIGAWPFFIWTRHWLTSELLRCALFGLIPALIVGIWGTRRFGVPGATGFFASALATAIFLYLRIWQMFMGSEAHRSPEPEYPVAFLWLLPLSWILLAAFVAVFSLAGTKTNHQLG